MWTKPAAQQRPEPFHGIHMEDVPHVLAPLSSSKLIPIDASPNHQIVHLFRFGKANGATHEPLNPSLKIDVLALDFLRIFVPHLMLLSINMPLLSSCPIKIFKLAFSQRIAFPPRTRLLLILDLYMIDNQGQSREKWGGNAKWTGTHGASGGLFSEFGEDRVLDCPLSENAFVGAAVGAAAVGTRPIVESASCFLWVAMDSLISQASKMRYMFGGQVDLPIVYRMSMYYGGSMAAHHSDRSHPIFMHIPGFKVVFPSTAYDGKRLLKTAIRDDDPVIFCEDHTILGARGHVPEEEYCIPFGQADIKREGSDVTIGALGGMVTRALQAAEAPQVVKIEDTLRSKT